VLFGFLPDGDRRVLARCIAVVLTFGCAFAKLHAVPFPNNWPNQTAIDDDTIAAYEKFGAEYGGIISSPNGVAASNPAKRRRQITSPDSDLFHCPSAKF